MSPTDDQYTARALDEKGRCCGRKPIVYKSPPHLYCPRCDRSFKTTGEQIPNWAWRQTDEGFAPVFPQPAPVESNMQKVHITNAPAREIAAAACKEISERGADFLSETNAEDVIAEAVATALRTAAREARMEALTEAKTAIRRAGDGQLADTLAALIDALAEGQ